MSSKPPSSQQPERKSPSSTAVNIASLLRHFVGLELIVETKYGRTFRGRLREADSYMNLVLSQTVTQSERHQKVYLTSFDCEGPAAFDGNGERFDWIHIRGPTIRYIVFGPNVDLAGIIRAGRDRERSAGDKYKRGIRKPRK